MAPSAWVVTVPVSAAASAAHLVVSFASAPGYLFQATTVTVKSRAWIGPAGPGLGRLDRLTTWSKEKGKKYKAMQCQAGKPTRPKREALDR